jgi:hypothetical protein
MCSEKKEKKENAACCDPEYFKCMSEMMNKCFTSQSGTHDCSAIMESMKSGGCCSPASEEKKKESCG